MKSNHILSTVILSCLFFALGLTSVQAQIMERAKNRTKQKAENRVDNKIDNSIDKGFNAIEGLFKKKKKKNKTEEASTTETSDQNTEANGAVDMGNVEVSWEEGGPVGDVNPNSWKGRFTMEVEEVKKGKSKGVTTIHYHMDTYKTAMVVTSEGLESTTVIYDLNAQTITTKVNQGGANMAMVMKMPKVTVKDNDVNQDGQAMMPKATGEYKTIQGYRCQKYVYEDDKMTVESWMTDEVSISMMDIANAMNAQNQNTMQMEAMKEYQGFVLESKTTEKGKDKSYVMRFLDVEEGGQDVALFDLSGYQVMKMPNIGGMRRN